MNEIILSPELLVSITMIVDIRFEEDDAALTSIRFWLVEHIHKMRTEEKEEDDDVSI